MRLRSWYNYLDIMNHTGYKPAHRKRVARGRAHVSGLSSLSRWHASGQTIAARPARGARHRAGHKTCRRSGTQRQHAGRMSADRFCSWIRPRRPAAGGAALSAAMESAHFCEPGTLSMPFPLWAEPGWRVSFPVVRTAHPPVPRMRLRRRRAGRVFPFVFSGMTRPRQRAMGCGRLAR